MQTLNRLRRDLPDNSTSPSAASAIRHSLSQRQPTYAHRGIDYRRSSLFTRNPDIGPAVQNAYSTTEVPKKRSDSALDPSLYLPKTDDANFYGRFVTLGYHSSSGPLNDPLRHRSERNKTFELWKRVTPNGWKFMIDARSGQAATTVLSASARERLRTASLNTPVRDRASSSIRVTAVDRPNQVVEYTLIPSPDHDLFQFGRDPYNNDFHIPGHTIEGHTWDPVSRLAFRVQCSRTDSTDIRIAAAGFDYANELFLGPFALRWSTESESNLAGGVDGGITVGLYMWKPKPHQHGDTVVGEWYEVSALGELYHLRVQGARGRKAVDVDNTLTDGCIIVNANSVLLFTTTSPSKDSDYLTSSTLSARLDQVKNTLCPITYESIPLRNAMLSNAGTHPRHAPISPFQIDLPPPHHPQPNLDETPSSELRRAGVFPVCGHVFELLPRHLNDRLTSCPKCRVVGRMIPLLFQTAPTLMARDAEFTHVLPCGHAMNLELGQWMAGMGLPTNDLLMGETEASAWGVCLAGRRRRCWFCGSGFYVSDLKKLYFERSEEE